MKLRKTLLVLSAILITAVAGPAATAAPEGTRLAFTAGTPPAPQSVKRILSAGNPSDVLLLCIAPEKLQGFAGFNLDSPRGVFFPDSMKHLPVLGKISGKSSTLGPEKIVALAPDLIVDIGNFTPNYMDQARKTRVQTLVPYVLFNGELNNTPAMLREAGRMLDVEKTTEPQARWAEKALEEGRSRRGSENRTVYLARGTDGLQTAEPGSIHTETLEWVGLKNVVPGSHKGLTRISPEQLLLWDPDMIFTEYPEFYKAAYADKKWSRLKAVKNRQVHLVPAIPFNWIDSPPSLNRLLGIKWLAGLLDGKPEEALVEDVMTFYKLFYHVELERDQALELLGPAAR